MTFKNAAQAFDFAIACVNEELRNAGVEAKAAQDRATGSYDPGVVKTANLEFVRWSAVEARMLVLRRTFEEARVL